MNCAIHPAEHPLLRYGCYQVEAEVRGANEPRRFRVLQTYGHRIECIVGSYDSVSDAVAAIEEHARLMEIELS